MQFVATIDGQAAHRFCSRESVFRVGCKSEHDIGGVRQGWIGQTVNRRHVNQWL